MKTLNLTQGKDTVVDDDVYEWARKVKWYAHRHHSGLFYAVRQIRSESGGQTVEYLHRTILAAVKGELTDSLQRRSG